MTTPIRLPDGSEIEIATDNPKQAAATARKVWAQRQASTPQPRSPLQSVTDFTNNVLDNAIPNWGDEIAGVGGALRAAYEGWPVAEGFKQAQRNFKADQARYKQAHPIVSKVSAVGGFGLGLAAPTGRVAQGASRAARMAHGAAVGAGYGAVAGAGEGETVSDRAGNATSGAALGAVAGAALPGLVKAGAAVGRAARQYIPGVDTAVRNVLNVPRAIWSRPRLQPGQRAIDTANRLMAARMAEGHISAGMGQRGAPASPRAIADEQARRATMGVPAMPGDTTEPLRNLTSWTSRKAGPGQTLVRERLAARKAEEADRVRRHVIEEMGPVVDPIAQVDEITRRAKDAVAPLYREAYAQPMTLTPEIQGIMATPAFRDAVPHAVRNIRNQIDTVSGLPKDPTALGFRLGRDGHVESVEALSTEGFDQVQRAMRDNATAGMRPPQYTGGQPQATSDTIHISDRARDLRARMGEQNEPYRLLTERYADGMQQRDALNLGQQVRKLTGHEINAQARTMPQSARDSWSVGARSALADEASAYGAAHQTGDAAGRVRAALGDETKREALGAITGNPGAVRGLEARLEAEHQGNILWREVEGNSRTAHRQANDAAADAAVGEMPSGNISVRGAAKGVINLMANRAWRRDREAVRQRIAQVMTETNPATVRDFMAEIERRAQQDREFADFLHRTGVLGAKGYGANIAFDNGSDE